MNAGSVDAEQGTVRAAVEVALPPDEAFRVFTAEIGSWYVVEWFGTALPTRPEGLRLEDAATTDHVHEEDTSMPATDSTVTLQGVTPYLYYPDAGAALDWLARVFGFRETARYVDDDGVVRESEMRVGDTAIQLSGGHAPGVGRGEGLLLIVHVDDVDAQHARVVAAGVEAPEPAQKPYGPRTFTVTDPWGYHWDFWQRIHDFVETPGSLREIRS